MTIRAVGPARGWEWLQQAVNLGRNNPRAVFGGAALLLLAVLALVIAMVVAMVVLSLAVKPEGAVSTVLSFVFAGALMSLMAVLMVGFLRLLDAVENGRPARARDVLAGLGDKPAVLRAIGFMLLLMVAQNLLVFGLIGLLAPDFGSWYAHSLQASMTGVPQEPLTGLPAGFGTAMVLMWLIATFCYAVQAIGLGQIALRGRNIAGALADGVSAAARNLLPLLVLFLAVIVAAILLALVLVLLALLVGVIGKLVGNWLLVLVAVPLYLGFVVAMMVVMFGVMYFMWRDICADAAPPVVRADQLEV